MKQRPFTIDLTSDETALAESILFDPIAFRGDHEAFKANAERAHQLTTSLIKRDGIPAQRVRYFTDSDYNPGGRGKSRKAIFERNGTSGNDLFKHPHFLKYLRYFIHGAELPAPVINAFTQAVQECGGPTSGDMSPLGSLARSLTRAHNIEPHRAADEFYKLCLDLGVWESYATSIRATVLQVRSKR